MNSMIADLDNINFMIERMSEAVYIFNSSGGIISSNLKASIDLGYTRSELNAMNIERIEPSIEDIGCTEKLEKLVNKGCMHYSSKFLHKNGEFIDVEVSATTVVVDEMTLVLYLVKELLGSSDFCNHVLKLEHFFIEQNRLLEANIKDVEINERRNRAIINVLPDMFFIIDSTGRYIEYHTSNDNQLFLSRDMFIGKCIADVMSPELNEISMQCIENTLSKNSIESFEYDISIKGVEKSYEIRMVKSSEKEVLAVVRDITMQKEEKELIKKLNYRDPLTDVYNRRYLEECIELINKKENLPIAFFIIDINGLKHTNEFFGYNIGDQHLKYIAYLLAENCPKNSVISRLGGDEFAVIIDKYTHEQCQDLVDSLYKSIECKSSQIVSVSIGWGIKESMDVSLRHIMIQAENHMLSKKIVESHSMRHHTIKVILEILNEKNEREKRHSEMVSLWAKKIAEKMGYSRHKVKEIEITGLLHDIGKIAIREEILNKEGGLTAEEFEEIKRHPEIGHRIIKAVDEYSTVAENILAHHERIDGTGYPYNLKGDNIPVVSKIIAIADAYEAMTADRSYRIAMGEDYAINELLRYSGTQFDIEIVQTFLEVLSEQ